MVTKSSKRPSSSAPSAAAASDGSHRCHTRAERNGVRERSVGAHASSSCTTNRRRSASRYTRNVGSMYAVYTIVGHWLEMLFCQLIRLGIVDGDYDRSNTMLWDWWLHPFPAEGIAGVLIAGALSPLREVLLKHFNGKIAPALVLNFLANQVVCTSIDYLTGMVANRNYELWDYRNMPFNFQGQICLQNSLVYTTAATFIAWVAYPARDRWLRRLPADVVNTACAALAPSYAFLCLTYFV